MIEFTEEERAEFEKLLAQAEISKERCVGLLDDDTTGNYAAMYESLNNEIDQYKAMLG